MPDIRFSCDMLVGFQALLHGNNQLLLVAFSHIFSSSEAFEELRKIPWQRMAKSCYNILTFEANASSSKMMAFALPSAICLIPCECNIKCNSGAVYTAEVF